MQFCASPLLLAPQFGWVAETFSFSLYLVALCGMGMLATTGVIVSEDTFALFLTTLLALPNVGELHGETGKILVSLDAVATQQSRNKGFAIGSAVIAAVALSLHISNNRQRTRPQRRSRQQARRLGIFTAVELKSTSLT